MCPSKIYIFVTQIYVGKNTEVKISKNMYIRLIRTMVDIFCRERPSILLAVLHKYDLSAS